MYFKHIPDIRQLIHIEVHNFLYLSDPREHSCYLSHVYYLLKIDMLNYLLKIHKSAPVMYISTGNISDINYIEKKKILNTNVREEK